MKYPKYVAFLKDGKKTSLMRRSTSSDSSIKEMKYYRDGGLWGVGAEFKDGKLVSVNVYDKNMDSLGNQELVSVTRKEYEGDNRGYI